MELDTSIRKTDLRTIAVMVAALLGLVGLAEFVGHRPAHAAGHIAPISATAASTASPVVADTKPANAAEERWAADESPQGTRPDAIH